MRTVRASREFLLHPESREGTLIQRLVRSPFSSAETRIPSANTEHGVGGYRSVLIEDNGRRKGMVIKESTETVLRPRIWLNVNPRGGDGEIARERARLRLEFPPYALVHEYSTHPTTYSDRQNRQYYRGKTPLPAAHEAQALKG